MRQTLVITPFLLRRGDEGKAILLIFLSYFLARFKHYCYLCVQLN